MMFEIFELLFTNAKREFLIMLFIKHIHVLKQNKIDSVHVSE